MNYQTKKDELQGIDQEDAANKLSIPVYQLSYYAWPQVFGSTTGPFNGIGGQAMSLFTIEAWTDGRNTLYFCQGKVLRISDKVFEMRY